MSKTQINYKSVVKELSKGLKSLQVVNEINPRDFQLREHRTLYVGSARQSGLTDYAIDLANDHGVRALVLVPNLAAIYDFIGKYKDRFPNEKVSEFPIVLSDYPDNYPEDRFDVVIIDDSSHYFSRYNMNKVYKYLAECTCSDAIIYRFR